MLELLKDEDTLALLMIFGMPIVAIICGSIITIIKMVFKHRERVKMIEHGIHPDYSPEEDAEGV